MLLRKLSFDDAIKLAISEPASSAQNRKKRDTKTYRKEENRNCKSVCEIKANKSDIGGEKAKEKWIGMPRRGL